jgi:hypothetical protein
VEVCRADEPEVIKFLKPRMKYLFDLWMPLPEPPATEAEAEHE